ncbi:LON peptidase substrate-binding domain-containing protein [Shewanella waksmanii]|uniref:LON peptidase substrate-binding domain-containing protein n=1 Tax=Shewanella waksmanii TaxID=213783 RepID=UPI003734E895
MVVENTSNKPLTGYHQTKTPTCKRVKVFPLPLFLLPGAVTQLRIFEPKYLQMVKDSYQDGGFVIARFDANQEFNVPNWGCHVEIIDFHAGDDNVLVIDVKALKLVQLDEFLYLDNQLLCATANHLSHWSPRQHSSVTDELAVFLAEIYQREPELKRLYSKVRLDDPLWVCARILEIIPLSLIEKEKFIGEQEFEHLVCFLQTVIFGQINKN